jgi:hypothetical protein
MKSIILCLLILVLNFKKAYSQEVPAEWEFLTLHTAHFDVIVNARQQELGNLYAQKLEQAYEFLRPYFSEPPPRTVVIINDKTDVTNGYATKIPYSHIMAYPVLPGPSDSLSESGDWALELLAHEYTHILTFEPAGGVFKYLRYVFGTIVSPNILLPTWWKEGIAVQTETMISKGGRLRSLYQDAILRSFAYSGKLFSFGIDQANEVLPSWPEGHRPYIFGSLLWSEMVAQKSPEVLDELNQHHGRRFPYFIEQPAYEALGNSYPTEYHKMMLETQKRAEAQVKKLQEKPINELQYLDLKTQYLQHPSISPDGKYMAVISVDETKKREIKLLEREANKNFLEGAEFKKIESLKEEEKLPQPQDAPPSGSIQRISWFHQSPKLIYDKIDNINRIERYSDLHVYDLVSQKSDQLTHGIRGREPSVSPDDQEVVFVKLDGGKTSLAVLNLADKKEQILWAAPLQGRISYPVYLDKNRIIYSLRLPTSEENLWVFDRTTNKQEKVLSQFKDSRLPAMSPQGLIFSSSKNGVHNLYLADKNLKDAHPVSHVLSAVFSSSYDPVLNDIYVTMMTEKGPQVARLSAQQWQNTSPNLPVIEPMYADRYPEHPPVPEIPNAVQSTESYSSFQDLWPHYWVPYFYTSSADGSLGVSASTSGFDPLKKHVYSLSATYETGMKRGSASGSYQNNQTNWPIVLQGSEINSYLFNVDNIITTRNSSISVWPDVWGLSRYALLELGARKNQSEYFDTKVDRDGAFARLVFSNASRSGVQISPESGETGYLSATNYYKSTDDLTFTAYTFGGTYYHSKWLPTRHAIMIRANGFHVDNRLPAVFGAQTTAYMPVQDTALPTYVMRGYSTGQFFGRKLYNVNLEYRFPIMGIYSGSGDDPYFFHNLHGAVIVDGVATDGFAYNRKYEFFERVGTERTFWNSGLEARLETTLGYVLPLNFIVGLYNNYNGDYGKNAALGISLQAGGSF